MYVTRQSGSQGTVTESIEIRRVRFTANRVTSTALSTAYTGLHVFLSVFLSLDPTSAPAMQSVAQKILVVGGNGFVGV